MPERSVLPDIDQDPHGTLLIAAYFTQWFSNGREHPAPIHDGKSFQVQWVHTPFNC